MSPAGGTYRLGPFLLASELVLPELESEAEAVGEPDVWIRLGKVPERLEDVVANETQWWASKDEYLQKVPGVAGFLVHHGREVVVEPAEGALAGDIRAYLLAPIFSVLCYQAGMYSLHASSVQVGAGVAAFLGDSGMGKSTLAAFMEKRGYSVVSDDICLLDTRRVMEDPGAQTMVVPVVPALKLWRSALEYLGAPTGELPRVYSREDKYRIKVRQTEDRVPLRAVYFLQWTQDAEADVMIEPAAGVHAVKMLMEFTHFEYIMKPTGQKEDNFLLCGRILGQVRAFTLKRPRNFARIEGVVDALVAHLEGLQR